MLGGNRPLGYTIIEVMIVLAISGVMFAIAADFISGKQAKTAFTEGTNEFASQLQAVIAQVTDGQYSGVPYTCTVTGGVLNITTGVGQQGTQSDCVFLGKFLHFYEPNNKPAYEIFSLAGARDGTQLYCPISCTGTPVYPTPIKPPSPADPTLQEIVPQSLDVKSVNVTTSSGSITTYGIGFTQSLGTSETSGGGLQNYQTGAQTVGLVYSPNLTASDATETSAAHAITNDVEAANSATICLTDDTRYAEILIGDSNSNADQLGVTVQVVPLC